MDKLEKPETKGQRIVKQIYLGCLLVLLEFALIYFITFILIVGKLYNWTWTSIVGPIAIIHFVVIPIGYFGHKLNHRVMLLVYIILCTIWQMLIIIYVALLLALNKKMSDDFKERSLHHIVLAVYSIVNIVSIILTSMVVITESDKEKQRKAKKSKIKSQAKSKDAKPNTNSAKTNGSKTNIAKTNTAENQPKKLF